eukprot:1136993-Pelagomonas_calceolata.AAC.5
MDILCMKHASGPPSFAPYVGKVGFILHYGNGRGSILLRNGNDIASIIPFIGNGKAKTILHDGKHKQTWNASACAHTHPHSHTHTHSLHARCCTPACLASCNAPLALPCCCSCCRGGQGYSPAHVGSVSGVSGLNRKPDDEDIV